MSGSDEEMEWDRWSNQASGGAYAETKDEVEVTVSFKWFESPPPQKCREKLEMALMKWANRAFKGNCDVLAVWDNGIAKIKIEPAPDMRILLDLCGKTLTIKDKKTVTILRVILSSPESETQMTDNASEPQNEQHAKQSSSSSPAASEKTETGILPVSQFMYLNNMFKKEIDNIVKKNGVIMTANTHVTFSAAKEAGSPVKALGEFTDLVQRVEYSGSDSTLKNRNPLELMDALQVVLTKESKLMLTLSSEEIAICGPSQGQDAFKKLLQITDNNLSADESAVTPTPQDSPPNIDMSINDPFLTTGLIFEENHWKLMNTSFHQELKNIEAKFGANIKMSEMSRGKVEIKTSYKRFGGNVSMESHALRALLRLYQKIATPQTQGAGQLLELKDDMTANVPPQAETPSVENISSTPSSSSVSKLRNEQTIEQSGTSSSTAVSTTGEETETGTLPVSQFIYMNMMYKREISDIEKKFGVKMKAEACVTFPAVKEAGSSNDALHKFTNLVQKVEHSYSDFPLKNRNPLELMDALQIVLTKESKLMLTLSSEEIAICGPSQSQDAIKKSLNTTRGSNWSAQKFMATTQGIPPKTDMNISDPFLTSGPITKSPLKFTQPYGAAGLSSSLMKLSNVKVTEGASGRPVPNSRPRYNIRYPDAPKGEGATAGDNKEETCPICMDTFFKKTQLKCKHEFCEECLEQLKKSMGPMCPVCKHVYGKIEGNQPFGTMTWRSCGQSLPGFPNCGHIVITYNIPSGIQTENHPDPGKSFHGTTRMAFLPDNKEGKEVLYLLKKAFEQKLIFTVGTPRTTGAENQVTWNDIHHKTSMTGGATGFGYPDPHYLRRVKEELKAKGIE
ncbi:uncharacterized protein LOC141794805 [Halichoeres trimaculatus]|uniref:uncharacterized protein LOC141794805 n=1 Tax=Halichoeres trimaculatus TaxID=147232 RepID=UPI003D9EE237